MEKYININWYNERRRGKKKETVIGVGFEPTPPKRPVPETGALDRSAIQPAVIFVKLTSTLQTVVTEATARNYVLLL